MQFIVRPSNSSSRFPLFPYNRLAANVTLLVGGLAIFSTGFFVGLLWNWDPAKCLQMSGDKLPTSAEGRIQAAAKYETFLVIIILSAHGHRSRRDTIRRTWFLLSGERHIKPMFAVGCLELEMSAVKDLQDEEAANQDMILFPQVKDTYSGLTHKLLASLKWIHNKFSCQFVLKVDDDTFVQVDRMFDEMVTMSAVKLYWGFFDGRAEVKRRGHWAESTWFLCDKYLPYALGGGYVLSSDLVAYIADNAHNLQFYNSEDVSLGAWLSPMKINRRHDVRFDTEYRSRGCLNKYLVTHKQSEQDMMDKFQSLASIGRLCRREREERKFYVYNWNVAPSMCCRRNETGLT